MSDLTVGQDVIVECPDLLDGEAFIASVEEISFSGGVVVDVRERAGIDAEVAQVHPSEVLPFTELFDMFKAMQDRGDLREMVQEEMNRAVQARRQS